jgi:hypothetical protein
MRFLNSGNLIDQTFVKLAKQFDDLLGDQSTWKLMRENEVTCAINNKRNSTVPQDVKTKLLCRFLVCCHVHRCVRIIERCPCTNY